MNPDGLTKISTHVLDLATGTPAPDVQVRLLDAAGTTLDGASTNADGRIEAWAAVDDVAPGTYRLIFDIAAYQSCPDSADQDIFFPQIEIVFSLDGTRPRVHIPVLLSPYGYTTYRGS